MVVAPYSHAHVAPALLLLLQPKDGRAERSQQDLQHASKDREVIVALAFNPRREELLAVVGSNTTK